MPQSKGSLSPLFPFCQSLSLRQGKAPAAKRPYTAKNRSVDGSDGETLLGSVENCAGSVCLHLPKHRLTVCTAIYPSVGAGEVLCMYCTCPHKK